MTGCSMAAKRMGNDLITGKQKIGDISNSMKTATASTKALGVAMNVFANVGFMLAITAISKVVSELAQAQENAVQAAKEATETYNDEISSIDDYKTRLYELHEELNSGNLSYEETKTKRTELMSIQDELIEKFGTEKGAIESVTEAVKGQVDALDGLNEKSYRDWVTKADKETIWTKLLPWGKSGLDQAIDYMETNKTVSFYDMANANSTTQDKYQAPITNEIRAIQEEIDKTIQSKYNLEKEFDTFKLTGTPDEIKSQLESIRQDYLDLSKEAFLENGISSEYWEAYRSEALDSINEVINSFDEGLKKHQETYQTYIEGMIKYDSEYSDEYATILQKRAELESAQNSGNKEAIQKARQEFMDAINSGIEASGNNENVKKYFESLYPELQAEFANWNFEFSINANTDGLEDQAKEIGEKYSATDLLDMINTEGTQEGEESFNKLIDKAIEYGVCTDNSAEEVQKLIDLLVELGIVQGKVQDSTPSNKTDILSTEEIKKKLDDLNSAIDSIQSAYDTLNSAVEEYNSNSGQLSIDTIQSLLSLSNEYLACLQVENGQLSLNADAINALAQSKLDEAQAIAVTQAMTELETIAKGENAQSTTNYISGNAALMNSLAQLSGSYECVAQAAMTAAQAQELSARISAASTKDKTATENVMKGLDTKLKLIQSTQNKIKSSGLGSSKKSSPTQSTTNKEKEYLDSYMTYMNKMLEGGKISYQQYAQQVSDKLEHMFKAGKISAKEYFDYTEKRLEQQKSVFDSALKAITGKLDDAIEEWQDKIKSLEKENDSYNDELDKYSSILSAIDKVYDNEINRIQDIIDGLKDANSEKERSIALEKAQWELDKARNQKTKKIYANGQYIYTTDSEAIRDAQENLNSAKLDVTISNLEKQIEVLEDFKTKWADIAKAFSTAQDEMNAKAMYGENFQYIILQNRLNDIFTFEQRYTAIEKKINDNQLLIDSYNQKVEYYQDLKEQWNSISSAYEEQLNRQHAAEILGANWEADILSGRLSTLESFKNSYIAIQQQITQAAIDSANAQANASNIASSGSGSSSSGGSSTNSGNEKVVQLQRFMNQVFGSNLTEDGIMGSKTKEAIKHMQLLIGANQTGVYDQTTYKKLVYYVGKTLNKENKELYKLAKSLGIPMYDKGTKNAKKGLAIVAENKPELLEDNNGNVSLVTEPSLIEMKGGETVKDAQETQELLNHNNLVPVKMMELPGINGKILKLSTDEFMDKVANVMPNYSSMIQSAIQMPKYDFTPVQNNSTPVVQNISLTLPNVTNEVGYNNLVKELNRLKLDAYQFVNKR